MSTANPLAAPPSMSEDASPLRSDALQATEVWLVRHGESAGNAEGRLQGQEDYPLSERGLRQAQAVAIRLRGVDFAALYSSDLSRALDTACEIGHTIGLPVLSDRRLREIDIGTWSGLNASELAARFPREWQSWNERRDPEYRRGGGESYADLRDRIAPTITELARSHPGGRILIVAHGGSLNAYIAHILGIPLDNMWRLSQENTAISRVLPFANPNTAAGIAGGRVLTLNDTTHLDGLR
jgi:2,3-bisphosphoglycerate-dependent phosphoglycerate mutase